MTFGTGLKVMKALLGAGFLALLSALIYGFATAPFFQQIGEINDAVWFQVTVLDFYLAIGFFSMWVFYREACWPRALAWTVLFVFTGNLGTILYLLIALWPIADKSGLDIFFHGKRFALE